ncbi:hypothetical protein KUCAC02_001491, partial [Chaenocephalus aceratus]
RNLKLPTLAQTAPRSERFKGGMLIRSRSIKLRKALCLGPKNNFPTLSLLSVLGGQEEECVLICSRYLCLFLHAWMRYQVFGDGERLSDVGLGPQALLQRIAILAIVRIQTFKRNGRKALGERERETIVSP